MAIFIPISKVDAKKRLVYGTISEETPDKSGEILDYESSKPQFQKWSDEQHAASGGKSKGNLRAMHDKIAAGKFTEITFDDEQRRIEGVAKVIDDDEWNKVVEGVYTGFSIGGGYVKRWKDPENPSLQRYTPELAEVSLVDNPCVPTATFEFIKEDGSTELRKFNHHEGIMTDTDSTRPADKGGVTQGFLAKDGSFHLKKADALARNDEVEAEAAAAPALEALKKLGEAVNGVEKKDSGDKEREKMAEEGEEEDKDGEHKKAKKHEKSAAGDLKKGMYGVSSFACLLESIDGLQTQSEFEAAIEGDGSEMPKKLKAWLKEGAELLRAMVAEETAELADEEDENVLAMANAVKGLAKLGAKLSAATKEHIERMHKSASEHMEEMDKCYKALGMGEEEEEPAEKNTRAAIERDALKKVLSNLTPQIEALTKQVQDQQAEIKRLADQPLPPKGSLRAVAKGTDGSNATGGDDVKTLQGLLKDKSPEEQSLLLIKAALSNPIVK